MSSSEQHSTRSFLQERTCIIDINLFQISFTIPGIHNKAHKKYVPKYKGTSIRYNYVTYVLKSPGRVDAGADLAVRVQLDQLVHDLLHVLVLALLVEKMAQLEPSDGLVLVVQLDGANLVHLPPLYPHRQKKVILLQHQWLLWFFHILFSILQRNFYTIVQLTDLAKLKKLLVSPVTMLDEPEIINSVEGIVGKKYTTQVYTVTDILSQHYYFTRFLRTRTNPSSSKESATTKKTNINDDKYY